MTPDLDDLDQVAFLEAIGRLTTAGAYIAEQGRRHARVRFADHRHTGAEKRIAFARAADALEDVVQQLRVLAKDDAPLQVTLAEAAADWR